MAINILENGLYSFSPGDQTVTINKWIPKEDLIKIVNTKSGITIYDVTDKNLLAVSYNSSISTLNINSTVIVLNNKCIGMLSTDDLQVYVDDSSSLSARTEVALDPIDRSRVSISQSAIDTDFEYGLQQGKWENIGMTNNRGYSFQSATAIPSLTSIAVAAGSRVVTVTFGGLGHGLFKGDVVSIQDTYFSQANGVFTVDSTASAGVFTYTARSSFKTAVSDIKDPSKTIIYKGNYYTSSQIVSPLSISVNTLTTAGHIITVTTTGTPHGLSIGNEIEIDGMTGTNPPNGSYVVTGVPSPTTFTYFFNGSAPSGISASGTAITGAFDATAGATYTVANTFKPGALVNISGYTGTSAVHNGTWRVTSATSALFKVASDRITGSITGSPVVNAGALYARSQGLVVHRPFDGGVQFSANAASNYEAQIRQTRRYFRYQSGKGTQMAAGIVLKPNMATDSIKLEDSPQGILITTKDQHNVQPGTFVTISNGGIATLATGTFDVNGTWQVTGVFSANELFLFKGVEGDYNYSRLDGKTFADQLVTGDYQVSVANWYGASNKIGMFDQQNGSFWDFDGQNLAVVKRYSTYQIGGRVSVTKDSNTVSQSTLFPTTFPSQLKPGDYVVIRGFSYRIDSIASNTSLTISPAYRGTTADNVTMSKTSELRIPQSSFNLDKIDGTGPSGYNIDLSKMQMFYIDYSWYGAGSIRWGVRDSSGKIIYVHKMANNNVNYEAFMRSGNIPARYETVTAPPKTYSTIGLTGGSTNLTVASTNGFPSSGTIVVKGQSLTEFINYTSLTSTTFEGLTRGQAGQVGLVSTDTIAPGEALKGTFSVTSASGLQVGQRIVARSTTNSFPDNTYITKLNGSSITTSQLITGGAGGTTQFSAIPMGSSAAGAIAASGTAPIAVELAYPSYSPNLSHWGTSVLIEGGFDDDKSALVTYAQPTTRVIPPTTVTVAGAASSTTTGVTTVTCTANTNIQPGQVIVTKDSGTGILNGIGPMVILTVNTAGTSFTVNRTFDTDLAAAGLTLSSPSYALFSIRVSPSVDNGIPSNLGVRDLINRMQIVLRNLNVSSLATGNLLVSLVANTRNSDGTAWSTTPVATNSLAQLAAHPAGTSVGDWTTTTTNVMSGDVLGSWYVTTTGGNIDISKLPTLSNSVLGGGSDLSDVQFYPDGPDILTLVVKNMSTSTKADVAGSLSWTEAQA